MFFLDRSEFQNQQSKCKSIFAWTFDGWDERCSPDLHVISETAAQGVTRSQLSQGLTLSLCASESCPLLWRAWLRTQHIRNTKVNLRGSIENRRNKACAQVDGRNCWIKAWKICVLILGRHWEEQLPEVSKAIQEQSAVIFWNAISGKWQRQYRAATFFVFHASNNVLAETTRQRNVQVFSKPTNKQQGQLYRTELFVDDPASVYPTSAPSADCKDLVWG